MKHTVPHCRAAAALLALASAAHADILRWDDSTVIPGTESITPAPAVDLSNWNTPTHNLQYADFSPYPSLNAANFSNSDLTLALFGPISLEGTNFTNATLVQTDFTNAHLLSANFTSAVIHDALLDGTTAGGFSLSQLYSTASYASGTLTTISLSRNTLTGINLAFKNISNSAFVSSELTGGNFKNATAHFTNFDSAQLGAALFTNADLANADFTNATLSGAVFTNANIHAANFSGATATGFTSDQLYATASYLSGDLDSIYLPNNDLTGWNFAGKNLTGAALYNSTLTSVDLTDADITSALLDHTTEHGFSPDQLYSTASYKNGALLGVTLGQNNLTGWNFSHLNLANSILDDAILISANFSAASLIAAHLDNASLDNADFTRADLRQAGGFTPSPSTLLSYAILPNGHAPAIALIPAETRRLLFSPLAIKLDSQLLIAGAPGNWLATLDLSTNALAIQTSGPSDKAAQLPLLLDQLASGKNGGTWSGPGITSSTLANDPASAQTLVLADNADLHLTTFHGQLVDDNTLLLTLAHNGDATLDNKVDSLDLTILAAHWQQQSGALWSSGDLTGDGKVDSLDLTVLAANWQFAAPLQSALAQLPFTSYQLQPPAPIPEPASLLLLLPTAAILLQRTSLKLRRSPPLA